VAHARVEAGGLDDVGVLVPDAKVVVRVPVGGVENRHAVDHEPDRSERRAGVIAILGSRRARHAEEEVLVLRVIRVPRKRPHVVAGHTGGSDSDIDWDGISKIGTIVFLMGVEHLPEIVAKLISHGRSSDTPAALIQEGTTQNQVVITGTLEDIVQESKDIRPPAVFVVGEVVRLREQIDWFVPVGATRQDDEDNFLPLGGSPLQSVKFISS